MPNWVTDENGRWHPAKEKVALKNISDKTLTVKQVDSSGKTVTMEVKPGEPYIYDGPDRAALFDWWEANGRPDEATMRKLDGQVTMGEDFRTNTEFLEAYAKARNAFGFASVEEYLKYLGYDAEKIKKDFESKASVITKHDLPARVKEIKRVGGGDDKANPGRNIRYGSFGDIPKE